jgi:hypothetical protein
MTDDVTRAVSLRFCEALSVNVGRRPGEWRSATLIAARARIRHAAEANRAVIYAREQGWLDVDGDFNVCLTEKGSPSA